MGVQHVLGYLLSTPCRLPYPQQGPQYAQDAQGQGRAKEHWDAVTSAGLEGGWENHTCQEQKMGLALKA